MPFISDLDFTVIEQGMQKDDKKSLHSTYQSLKQFTTVLDRNLGVYDEETFYKNYEKTRKLFRLVEGKATWKLLFGKDYIADLPQLPLEEIYGSLYNEIKYWWRIFIRRLVQGGKDHDDVVIRNSVCYKTVSEILKMELAFHHDMMTFSRSKALEIAKAYLNEKERVLVERLEILARKRFIVNDTNIVEETKDFLFVFLDRFCKEFIKHDYARPLKNVTQKVDCLKDEMFLGREEHAHIGRLIDYVKENWSYNYRGAYLVSGAYFQIDDLVLLLEVDPVRPPKLPELTALYLLDTDATPELKSRIHLYLLMPHAAFKINAVQKNDWHSILSPSSNPDLFELLDRAEFIYDQGTYYPTPVPIWTPLIKNLLLEMKKELFENLQPSKINRKDTISFLRRFWKAAQLCLIARSMQTDEIFYPLTLPSIKRGLTVQGISLPLSLHSLEDAYRDVIGGKNCDISTLIPDAVNYLKEIDS